ncbi:hypothetical protein VB005_02792 [Metarhizium brunneum]
MLAAISRQRQQARRLGGALAAVFEKLGYGFENATWRNVYLTMTLELRFKDPAAPKKPFSPPLNRLGSAERCLDGVKIGIDGPEATKEDLTIHIRDSEGGSKWTIQVSNGALTYRRLEREHEIVV